MSVSWPFSAPAEMLNTKVNIEAELMLEGMSLEQKVGQMNFSQLTTNVGSYDMFEPSEETSATN